MRHTGYGFPPRCTRSLLTPSSHTSYTYETPRGLRRSTRSGRSQRRVPMAREENMLPSTRRWFLLGAAGLVFAGRGFAQTGHEQHGGLYERLQTPGRIGLPDIA